MAEIVNLRRSRKRKAGEEKERVAAVNRLVHGRPKAEETKTSLVHRLNEKRLEAHQREAPADEVGADEPLGGAGSSPAQRGRGTAEGGGGGE